MTAGAKNKAVAYDFVKWATGDEAQTLLADNSIVPVRTTWSRPSTAWTTSATRCSASR